MCVGNVHYVFMLVQQTTSTAFTRKLSVTKAAFHSHSVSPNLYFESYPTDHLHPAAIQDEHSQTYPATHAEDHVDGRWSTQSI
jgi:hypothetical protein